MVHSIINSLRYPDRCVLGVKLEMQNGELAGMGISNHIFCEILDRMNLREFGKGSQELE